MTGLTARSAAHHFGPGRYADHYLYRCYDADGRLLYIGCTSDVARRIAAHRRGGQQKASRWLSIFLDRVEVEGPFASRDLGRDAEGRAIKAERPLFNYQQRADVDLPASSTKRAVAAYLVEHGHLELAVETVCTCWRETAEAGQFDPWCYAHEAAHVAGLTDLRMRAA